jgi:hypothetical protein
VICRPVGEAIDACPRRGSLKRLRAGSWIRADFGVWIGGPEKNRAWELLGQVRAQVAPALADPALPAAWRDAARAALRSAEGSDWFWWLDGQFHSIYRAEFDQIFRGHLRQACEAIGKAAPEVLDRPIPAAIAPGKEATVLEPPVWLTPRIDGFESDFFEWEGAIRVEWAALARRSAMERSRPPIAALEFGFTPAGDFLLRIDPPTAKTGNDWFKEVAVELTFRSEADPRHLSLELDEAGNLAGASWLTGSPAAAGDAGSAAPSGAQAAARKILEVAVPAGELGLTQGRRATFQVRLRLGGEEVSLEEVDMRVPPAEAGGRFWSAS